MSHSIEEITRFFLAESNKYLDFSLNPELVWLPDGKTGYEIRARVVSVVSQEFTWFVRHNPRAATKLHTGVLYEESECVYRLDVNDGHKGKLGTHLHRPYTATHGIAIADFVTDVPVHPWHAVNWFLGRAKIVEIPDEYWSLVPTVPPAEGLLFGGWDNV